MENPFELILERLDRIEKKLDRLENNQTDDVLMNLEEVAKYLNYAKASIYGLVHRRELPHIKTGKKLYFRKSDIDTWLDARKVKSKSEIKRMANEYILKNPLL